MEFNKTNNNYVNQGHKVPFSLPFTLQSLCSKVILLQENDKEEYIVYDDEDNNGNNTVLSNKCRLERSQKTDFSPELANYDFHLEDLNLLNINTKEWINTQEFDNIIHELKDPFHNLEYDIINFGATQTDCTVLEKTNKEEIVACSFFNSMDDEKSKANNTSNDDLIDISSTYDTEFEFSLPDNIDTISISSLENMIECVRNDDKTQVTFKTCPQEHYISDFNQTTDIKKGNLELGAITKTDTVITDDELEITRTVTQDLDDSCSGYNSSDFEFITEEDAKSDGLIINFQKAKYVHQKKTCATVEVSVYNANDNNKNCRSGVSSNNTVYNRNNHQIPEGDDYFELFSGRYAPTTPWMFENKSMGSLVPTEYAGLGFDIGLLSRQIRKYQPDDEYNEEADECAKKIIDMYPRENRKRRRFD